MSDGAAPPSSESMGNGTIADQEMDATPRRVHYMGLSAASVQDHQIVRPAIGTLRSDIQVPWRGTAAAGDVDDPTFCLGCGRHAGVSTGRADVEGAGPQYRCAACAAMWEVDAPPLSRWLQNDW
jgi:hypothetical protein